jgi:hypothetical protein
VTDKETDNSTKGEISVDMEVSVAKISGSISANVSG